MSHHSLTPAVGEQATRLSTGNSLLEGVLLRLAGAAEEAAKALTEEAAATPPTRRELVNLADRIYVARRARDKFLDHALLKDPAWDMLLALYCLPARGEFLSVDSLSHAAVVPLTTGLRWQKQLTDAGLMERGPHGVDHRKQMVRLTDEGRAVMERYLTRIYTHSHPPPSFPERAGG